MTRRSIIDLTNAWSKDKAGKIQLEISERWLTMEDLVIAGKEGRVSQCTLVSVSLFVFLILFLSVCLSVSVCLVVAGKDGRVSQ